MKNEIYAQILEKQEAFEAQLKEETKILFGEELDLNVRIDIHGIPFSMMPEGSKEKTTENIKWFYFSEGIFKPSFYSKTRKFKIVFEDEPETSNQNPVTSIQP